jgi:leader peptidase (prepilin peptidase)/N-methyltransferase
VDFRIYPLLFAPFAGSFLGVLIVRLPQDGFLARARSACGSCGAVLTVRDLVPIFSYLALRGQCRRCGDRIDPFHLWAELAAVVVAASACFVAADPLWLWADCVLGWGLLALGWIDARTRLLPDALTLPLLALGLMATAWMSPEDIAENALAAAVGVTLFLVVAAAYRRLRGRDGLGVGDAKLMGVAGAWLGWSSLPWIVFGAAMSALLVAGAWRLAGRTIDRTTAIPFGPFLALAIWAARLLG